MSRTELAPQTRLQILKLRALNHSYRAIHAALPAIPLSTIRATITRAGLRSPSPRTGRPRSLTEEQRDHIYDVLAHVDPCIKMRDLLAEIDFAVGERAMRLLVRELGFPRLLARRGW